MNLFKMASKLHISTMVFLAFFIFGSIKILSDTDISADLKDKLITQTESNPFYGAIFIKTLDELTPNKKILGINWPIISWFHLETAIVLIFLSWAFMYYILKSNKWTMFGVFLLLIIAAYFIGTLLLYLIYYSVAETLNFTTEEASTILMEYNNNFENVYLPLVLYAIFASMILIKTIFKRLRK